MRKHRRLSATLTAVALLVSLLPVFAMPAAAVSPIEEVATGLNAPYKLAFDSSGALYVAESGTGGEDCFTGTGPEGDEVEICHGTTGSVTRVADGTQERVVTGLPSVVVGEEPLGPTAVEFSPGNELHVLIGLGGDEARRTELGDERFGTLLRVPSGGDPVVVADLVAFEEANNPDSDSPDSFPDSNPFGLAFEGANALVADAGGNTLLEVTPAGEIGVEAVFPARFVDPPPFIPAPGQIPMQAVPTSIELDPEGTRHVSQLTGFPFPLGGANVYTVSDGTVDVAEPGFTNIMDIAFADDGTLYVLEFASNSLLAQEGPQAALVEVRPDGTRKTLLYGDQIPTPGGVEVGPDGMLYLSIGTLLGPGAGSVVRVDPSVASDAATAEACDPANVPGSGFGDIAPNPHREAIECAAWWGVVNGFSPEVFGPGETITRGQIAAMVARALRAAGIDLPTDPADAFPDDDDSPHEADINALAEAGVVNGMADGNYGPNDPVTRAQVASLLVRAYALATGEELPAGTNAFTDDDDSPHQADINAAAGAGWINGRGGGIFDPNASATRAELASLVMRMLSTLVEEGVATPPSA